MARGRALPKLKLEAPGLTEGRPAPDGTRRWRYVPAPVWRKRGFTKSYYLFGEPGTPVPPEEWKARGFKRPPDGVALTLDGPPLGIEAAAKAVHAITEFQRAQFLGTLPAAPKGEPRPATGTLNALLDRFITAARAGEVKKRDKETKRLVPISPKTVEGYARALVPVRDTAGPERATALTRDLSLEIFEALIDNGHHSMAVASNRALSRAMNWLRTAGGVSPDLLPAPEAYEKLGLGTPNGRTRMATEDEAAAMYAALFDPAAFNRDHGLGLHADDLPRAQPAAAAMFLMALWTIQRGNDTVSFTPAALADGRLRWTQSKNRKRVDLPLQPAALEARRIALATRSAAGIEGDDALLFIDGDTKTPYRQVNGRSGEVYYSRFNRHWTAARALAGHVHPSLIGNSTDPFGRVIPPLRFQDTRDTGVTRLFEAFMGREGALASIAAWHGSDVPTLLGLLKNYLDLNPRFANAAGDAYLQHAKKLGYEV